LALHEVLSIYKIPENLPSLLNLIRSQETKPFFDAKSLISSILFQGVVNVHIPKSDAFEST
jgi:hypothetical protein